MAEPKNKTLKELMEEISQKICEKCGILHIDTNQNCSCECHYEEIIPLRLEIKNMDKHIHHFVNIGGGCGAIYDDINKRCDSDYKCTTCGEKFRVYTSFQGYTYLPREFDSKIMNEAEIIEHKAINKMLEQNETQKI